MATAVCAISLNFYETRKFLSTTSKFLGLMKPARKKMLSAGLRWACGWERYAVSVGPALQALRKEREDFFFFKPQKPDRKRKHYFEFSDSKTHLHGHLDPVNIQMLTAKCLCSSVGKWGSIPHFKAKEK